MAEDRALVAVKTVHTAIWAFVETAMAYLLVSGAMRRSDRWAGIAAVVMAGETAVWPTVLAAP